jgi:hypothetical protein
MAQLSAGRLLLIGKFHLLLSVGVSQLNCIISLMIARLFTKIKEGELYIDPTLVSQNGKKRPQRGSVKDTKNPSRSSASASAKSHPVLRFRVYHDRIYTLAKVSILFQFASYLPLSFCSLDSHESTSDIPNRRSIDTYISFVCNECFSIYFIN